MKTCQILFFAIFVFTGCKPTEKKAGTDFVRVSGTHFEINGKPYYFMGTNFWYGLNLGSKGAGGDRERLVRELDRLSEMGVNNLRIVAGSEGPDVEPYRMLPSLQTSPGVYNEQVLDGLDFLLDEMKKRNMYAVMCLNNFWNWSGGLGQYIVWSGAADAIPYPPPHPGGNWDVYQKFAAQFYSNAKAVELFSDHIRFIVSRKNGYSGMDYKNDPTIMSWELGNEPRGINNVDAFLKWVDDTAGLIKSLDPNHLVTTGSEGKTSSPYSGTDLEKDHASRNIDYATIHIWVQNWGIFDPMKADSTYDQSVKYARDYLNDQEQKAAILKKPVVLEEFGIARDLNNYDPLSPASFRDKYYASVFEEVFKGASSPNSVVAGCNFWAWAGEGRPRVSGDLWKGGDNFIGDPPHENQGWYSVYDIDSLTIKVIRDYATKMNGIGRK